MKWERISRGHYRRSCFEIIHAGRARWEIWQAPATGWAEAYPAFKGPTLIDAAHSLQEAKIWVDLELRGEA